MRRILLTIAPILLASVGLGFAEPPAKLAPDTQAAWDSLKKLAGDWEGEAGEMKATVVYRVTSGGHTVMETLGPGSPHEMVTMYHLDGPRLVATHYCSAGNQPLLVLDGKASKPGNLVFSFAGGTNLNPQKDDHIHSLQIKIVDQDHIESDWGSWKDGRATAETMKFVLTRKR